MRFLTAVSSWLDAGDPGAVRRRHGGRTAFAVLGSWSTMRFLSRVIHHGLETPPTLMAVISCFVAALVVVDPRPRDRLRTMVIAAAVGVAAVLVAALLAEHPGVRQVLLVMLMFTSFAIRRFGLRAGEVALVATLITYFAGSSGASSGTLWWFIGGTLVGFGWITVWQFVLLPFDPRRSLLAATRSFYRRAGELVGSIAQRLDGHQDRRGSARASIQLRRQLDRVRLSRRVIENQYSGVLDPGTAQSEALEQLHLALFAADQGLSQMVDTTTDTSWLATIDREMVASFTDTLRSMSAALVAAASPEAMSALASEAQSLRDRVAARASGGDGTGLQLDEDSRPWALPAIAIARGAQRVARSVARARELAVSNANPEAATASDVRPVARAPDERPSESGPRSWHPTTILGLQAVLAAILAMIVGRVFDFEHTEWIFWNAFVVVAGSAGETLRRLSLRVLGTSVGAAVGLGVALALPNADIVVPILGTAAVFLAIYEAPVSYTWMVFWLNVAFVAAFAQLGGNGLDLFRDRTIATAVGGVFAGVVTATILPIRVADRFRQALRRYMGAVDAGLTAWAATGPDDGGDNSAVAASAEIEAAYPAVKLTLEAAVFETNPFPRTGSPLSEQGVRVAAVDVAIHQLIDALPGNHGSVRRTDDRIVQAACDHVHRDIAVVATLLGGGHAQLTAPLAEAAADERATIAPGRLRSGPVSALGGLHTSLQQLALALGASA